MPFSKFQNTYLTGIEGKNISISTKKREYLRLLSFYEKLVNFKTTKKILAYKMAFVYNMYKFIMFFYARNYRL